MVLKQNKLLSFNLDIILLKISLLFKNNGICREKFDIAASNLPSTTMISRFNLDQKRLTFYENPELFHNEFTELISSNNDNEFLYSTEEPIVVLNKDKTLKLTLVKDNKELEYILFSNHSISILPQEKIKIHKAIKDVSNYIIYKLNN